MRIRGDKIFLKDENIHERIYKWQRMTFTQKMFHYIF